MIIYEISLGKVTSIIILFLVHAFIFPINVYIYSLLPNKNSYLYSVTANKYNLKPSFIEVGH